MISARWGDDDFFHNPENNPYTVRQRYLPLIRRTIRVPAPQTSS